MKQLALVKQLALAALLLATPAAAQERPKLTPDRDVDILYAIAGPKGPLPQRLRWGVSLGKLRVDPPSPGLFMVVDTNSHRTETVREQDRVVLQIDNPTLPGQITGATYTRRDTARFAGLDCTNWATSDNDGRPTLACITSDGVLLRATEGDRILVMAVEVTYSPQGPEVFRVPADYRRVTAPTLKR